MLEYKIILKLLLYMAKIITVNLITTITVVIDAVFFRQKRASCLTCFVWIKRMVSLKSYSKYSL